VSRGGERGRGILEEELHALAEGAPRGSAERRHQGAVEADLAARRFFLPGQATRQRRLARAGFPDQGDDAAALDGEIDPGQRVHGRGAARGAPR
jgi:hypothetical protein